MSDLVPDAIKTFVQFFSKQLRTKDLYEIADLYDTEWNKLTDKYFKASPWPSADSIAPFVENDDFLVVYKEMYFRHMYSKLSPTVDDRFDSFQNYIDLFNIILGLSSSAPDLELPMTWLWDIIDEFIYQFQSFHQFRAVCMSAVPPIASEDTQLLKDHPNVWGAPTVMRYLHALVKKGGMDINKPAEKKEEKRDDKKGEKKTDDEVVNGIAPMFRALAQYSLIGLLRVNCLLGDYFGALKSLDPIDLSQKRTVITRVLACHLSLYYYMGFAYLCLHRYLDALKTFSYFLQYHSRSRDMRVSSQVGKRVEKMQGLLGIAIALCPTANIEDSLLKILQDRFGGEKSDKFQRLQAGELAVIEETFEQSCPKFITPCAPDYTSTTDRSKDALRLQKSVFMKEVRAQLALSNVYSYLRMCSSITCTKLASFLKTDTDTLASHLLNLKHKGRILRWRSGSATTGDWQITGEVNFHVADDMVHVAARPTTSNYGPTFIRNIVRLEDMIKEIRSLRPFKGGGVGGPGGIVDDRSTERARNNVNRSAR